MRDVLRQTGKAISDWQMIRDGDRLAVGLSGGKDSFTLLRALTELKKFSPVDFSLEAIHIDLGWGQDLEPLARECQRLGVPLHVESTQIAAIVFEERREKNPCSLCANMRRGALNNKARALGITRVALAHHLDDAAETLLLNLFYSGRLQTFRPVTYLDRSGITVIRPFVYLEEARIEETAGELELETLPSPCPAAPSSRRQFVKGLLQQVESHEPRVRQHILAALKERQPAQIWGVPPAGNQRPEQSPGAG